MSDEVIVIGPTEASITLVETDTVLIIQSNGGSGPAGPQGPPGTPGGSAFIYTQVSPAATWIITHNLNSFVHVTIMNVGGTIVDTDVVETSLNTTTVTFSQPQAGTAVISP